VQKEYHLRNRHQPHTLISPTPTPEEQAKPHTIAEEEPLPTTTTGTTTRPIRTNNYQLTQGDKEELSKPSNNKKSRLPRRIVGLPRHDESLDASTYYKAR
jgi:hypothetical protein